MVVRLPTCVRLGPMIPGDTPWIVWQPMHAPVLKSCAPRVASPLDAATVTSVGSGVSGTVHVGSLSRGHVPVAVSAGAAATAAAAGAAPFAVSADAAAGAGNTGPCC